MMKMRLGSSRPSLRQNDDAAAGAAARRARAARALIEAIHPQRLARVAASIATTSRRRPAVV